MMKQERQTITSTTHTKQSESKVVPKNIDDGDDYDDEEDEESFSEQVRQNLELALHDEATNSYFGCTSCGSDDDGNTNDEFYSDTINKNERLDELTDDTMNYLLRLHSYTFPSTNNTVTDCRPNNIFTVPVQYNGRSYIRTDLVIQNKYNFRFLQADSAFGYSGDDCTGSVLWGASICMAHYILTEMQFVEVKKDTVTKTVASSFGEKFVVPTMRVIELGCGSCALPTLAISRRLAEMYPIQLHQRQHYSHDHFDTATSTKMIATDFNQQLLWLTRFHIRLNEKHHPDDVDDVDDVDDDNSHNESKSEQPPKKKTKTPYCIETRVLDWQKPQNYQSPYPSDGDNEEKNDNDSRIHQQQDTTFDTILASDVIYGVSSVPALVRTIDQLLVREQPTTIQLPKKKNTTKTKTCHGRVYIATLDGRRGIDEFRLLMKEQTNLRPIDTIHYTSDQLVDEWGYYSCSPEHDKCTSNETNRSIDDCIPVTASTPSSSSSSSAAASSRWAGGSYTIYVYERQQ